MICTSRNQQRLCFNGKCWRVKAELTADVLLWKCIHGKRSPGRKSKKYVDYLFEETLCR